MYYLHLLILYLFVFSKLFPATSFQQPDYENDECEDFVDIKVQNAIHLRRMVTQIKLDCGELCDTSSDAEKTIHRGKV